MSLARWAHKSLVLNTIGQDRAGARVGRSVGRRRSPCCNRVVDESDRNTNMCVNKIKLRDGSGGRGAECGGVRGAAAIVALHASAPAPRNRS